VAFLALPSVVCAQEATADSAREAKLHFGPLGLSPKLTLGNIGVDTNVFNSPVEPTRDFTIQFLPSTNAWLPVGKMVLSSQTAVPLTYFEKAASQRSVGFTQSGRADFQLIHLVPYVGGGYSSTYNRPNAEIDERVQRVNKTVLFGSRIRLGSGTSLVVGVQRDLERYPTSSLLDAGIGAELNRDTTKFDATYRMVLTPMTTFVVQGSLSRDRFEAAMERNANNVSVMPGFELRRDARLSGRVFAGFRSMRPLSSVVPSYVGPIAATSLSFLARDTTRIDGVLNRDLDYSIQQSTPYFVSTTAQISLTQIVVGHVDAVGRLGRTLLSYRNLQSGLGGGIQLAGREDRTNLFGAGMGYRFNIDARVGFDLNYVKRLSALDGRLYSGMQFGGTMTYGF
jgi:hypothetical protein